MILTMNIGNTNFAIAVIHEGNIYVNRISVKLFKNTEDFIGAINDILQDMGMDCLGIAGIAFASVNPFLTKHLEEAIRIVFSKAPVIVNPFMNMKLDLTDYDISQVGNDRITVCEAAISKYHTPIVVFDFGTATTINVVDTQGRFLGGSILAGLKIGIDALARGTAQLPKIELSVHTPLVGRNAKECIASGAVFGNVSMLEGMVARIEKKLGQKVTVVITGGNSDYIVPLLNIPIIHEPNLLFEGLLVLYRANKPKG